MIDKKLQGKRNRAAGARFELKVRADLESKGWIVDKWSNNVEFSYEQGGNIILLKEKNLLKMIKEFEKANANLPLKGKLVKVKNKFLGQGKPMMLGAGFPDFVAFKSLESEIHDWMIKNIGNPYYTPKKPKELFNISKEVIGVEAKSNGYLSKEEKEKCKWLLENNVFSKILIAKKGKKRGEIEYVDFSMKYSQKD